MKLMNYEFCVWLPIITALAWSATLLTLLTLWIRLDHGKTYRSEEPNVVFISEVGAAHLNWFIPGCVMVSLFYIGTLFAERKLRGLQRIPKILNRKLRFWGYSTLFNGTMGGCSLMMLSFLDTFHHPTAHWTFTLLFMIFVTLSALSQTTEVIFLHKEYPQRAHLKRNALLKGCVIVVSAALGVVFGSLYVVCEGRATSSRCNSILSAAATCEWTVSFLMNLYFLTFALDFWPAGKTSSSSQLRKKLSSPRESEKSGDLDSTIKEEMVAI